MAPQRQIAPTASISLLVSLHHHHPRKKRDVMDVCVYLERNSARKGEGGKCTEHVLGEKKMGRPH